jgi:copper chaperone CopZ
VLFLAVSLANGTRAAEPAPLREIRVQIKGMVCSYCSQSLLKMFKREPGVEDATASLKGHELKIFTRAPLADARIEQLVRDAGLSPGPISKLK